MKRNYFLITALLLMLAGVQTAFAQKVKINLATGETVKYKISQIESIEFEEANPDGHEWVDLGLPSGTLWAETNIGAESPQDYGHYFAWGETTWKGGYTWGNYLWMTKGKDDWDWISKYTFADGQTDACWYDGETFIGDGKKELEPDDDAATVNWGSDWRMPTKEQFEELINASYTTTEWTTEEGIAGLKITSIRNSNTLFLPATGYHGETGTSSTGTTGNYWARTHDTSYSDHAFELFIKEDKYYCYATARELGQSVRPVRTEGGTPLKLVEHILLNHSSLFMAPNKTKLLTATVYPSDADNQTVTWESSNPSVATILPDGLYCDVIAKAEGSCKVTCRATDGSRVQRECIVTVSSYVEHKYVDLGLPSGTLWATCNVGADAPEEYGDYFAWGETKPKSEYSWSTYFDTNDDGSTFNKYNNDGGLTELQPEDDAATVNWGSDWQMPSLEQIDELFDYSYVTLAWIEQNGVNGRRITSKINGNSIFLPAAGYYSNTSYYQDSGTYWLRSLDTSQSNKAYELISRSSYLNFVPGNRYYGRSVRPVRKK